MLPLSEHDWRLFIHLIDDSGNILLNNDAIVDFKHPLSTLDGEFLFGKITFKRTKANFSKRFGYRVLPA